MQMATICPLDSSFSLFSADRRYLADELGDLKSLTITEEFTFVKQLPPTCYGNRALMLAILHSRARRRPFLPLTSVCVIQFTVFRGPRKFGGAG